MAHGGRGLLAGPGGAVACELEPLGVDEAGAHYELRVTNGTSAHLAATANALPEGEERAVAALALEVRPQAAIRTGFSLDPSLAYARVSAEVHGEGVHLIVEAAPPRAGRPRRPWLVPATAGGFGALLTGTVLVVLAFGRPHVVDARLGPAAGGGVQASWMTRGGGTRTLLARDPHGDVLVRSTLAPQGVQRLPRETASVSITIANAFGRDVRDAAYAAATAPPARIVHAALPPRIAALAIDPPLAHRPLTVRYDIERADGVRLDVVDRSGAVWFGTTAAPGRGAAAIPQPPAGAGEPYTLLARISGPGGAQVTRLPVPAFIIETPAPSPQPTVSSAPSSAPGAPAAARGSAEQPAGGAVVVDVGGGDTFAIAPQPVRAAQPFSVEIPSNGGARISIVRDADGAEIAAADLAPGRRVAAFVAPARGAYTVRVALRRGNGSEVLVRRLPFGGS